MLSWFPSLSLQKKQKIIIILEKKTRGFKPQGHVAMLGVPGFADEKFREVSITRVHGRSIDINRVELEASPVHSFTHKHIGQAHNLSSTSYIQV